jgi:cytochrome c-type biogenesis protein CcmH/NrfG
VLGDVYVRQGRIANARDAYSEALARNPRNSGLEALARDPRTALKGVE